MARKKQLRIKQDPPVNDISRLKRLWRWTGWGAKKLWDWQALLFIPLSIALLGFYGLRF